jgi:hypothetical protein
MTRPHPFKDDEKVLDADGEWTGIYRLGCPYIFFLVERIEAPRDDRDFKTFREHVEHQRMTPQKLTEKGMTDEEPMKYKSDFGDCFRMWAADFRVPAMTEKTVHERYIDKLEEAGVKPIVRDEVITPERQMEMEAAAEIANERLMRELGLLEDEDDEDDYEY